MLMNKVCFAPPLISASSKATLYEPSAISLESLNQLFRKLLALTCDVNFASNGQKAILTNYVSAVGSY